METKKIESYFKWWEIGLGILFLIIMYFFFYFTAVHIVICDGEIITFKDKIENCSTYSRIDIISETDKYMKLNESIRNEIRQTG